MCLYWTGFPQRLGTNSPVFLRNKWLTKQGNCSNVIKELLLFRTVEAEGPVKPWQPHNLEGAGLSENCNTSYRDESSNKRI